MKTSSLASLALVLALASLSLAQITPSCTNRLLTKLKGQAGAEFADAFYAVPTESTSDVCKLQWGTNKTCCKPEKITAIADKLISAWKNRINSFIKSLDQVEKDIVPRAENAGLRASEMKSRITSNPAKFNSNLVDPNLTTLAEGISDNASTLTEQFKPENFVKGKSDFIKNIKQCFDTIKVFRSGALCGACSGNAEEFLEGNKAKITQETCVKITSACAKSWQFMFETNQTLKLVKTIAKVDQAISATGAGAAVPKIQDSTLTELLSSEILTLISDLRTASAVQPEALVFNDSVKNICTKLLTFDNDKNGNIDGDVEKIETVVQIEKAV